MKGATPEEFINAVGSTFGELTLSVTDNTDAEECRSSVVFLRTPALGTMEFAQRGRWSPIAWLRLIASGPGWLGH
jgi:hypothetical protein